MSAKAVPSTTERLRLAMRISSNGKAHLLDANNFRIGTSGLGKAVDQDVPFYVDVDEGVLAVDFDQTDGRIRAQQLRVELLVLGYRSRQTRSGGEGRAHVFAEIVDPIDFAEAARLARGLGGDVRDAIRPPGAKHRRGGRSELEEHDEDDDDDLGSPDRALAVKPLGQGGIQALRAQRVVDRSQLLYRLACSAANAGWRFGDFNLAISTPGNAAHDAYQSRRQERGAPTTEQWIENQVWRSAVEWINDHPAVGAADADLVRKLLRWQETRSWAGRSGPTSRAVFLSLVVLYRHCGVEPFTASVRQISEHAGISRRSVRPAIRTLIGIGILNPESGKGASRPDFTGSPANAWSFEHTLLEPIDLAGFTAPLDHLAHDIFRYGEMGKDGQYVFDTLCIDPGLSAPWISKVTGLSPATVKRLLLKLSNAGMAFADSHGGWAPTGLDLDVVAKERGTADHAARQAALHALERQAYNAAGMSNLPQLPRSGGVSTSWGRFERVTTAEDHDE